MPDPTTALLRLDPQSIPQVRAAYDQAIRDMQELIRRARHDVYISEPWLGDPISLALVRIYNGRFAVGPGSAFAQLEAYRDELVRTQRTLAEMEETYRRTEGENAALWGRLR